MLEKLTKEQEKLMLQTRDEWVNLFFDNVKNQKGIDKKMFEDGIEWLYTDLLHKPKPKVVYCDSWLSCLLTIAIFKDEKLNKSIKDKLGASVRDSVGASVRDSVWASVRASVWDSVGASVRDSVWASVWDSVRASVGDSVGASVWASVGDSVGDSVWASVGDSVWASVRDSVRDSVGDSVWASVGASVRDSVRDSVGASVGDSVWASVGASVRDSVGASVGDSVWASVGASVRDSVRDSVGASVRASVRDSVLNIFNSYSSYIDLSNYGWVSFYDFFEKINIVDDFNFKQYKKILKSGVFNAYEFENYVFAIQPPIYVERNSQGRLHSTSTAAVKFRDGSSYYFINGRPIPEWVVEKKDSIIKDQFLQEKNSDIKGAIYEVLGSEGIINLLGAEITDSKTIHHANGDVETVELLKTKDTFPELDDDPLAWVKMTCPSTGTNYLIGVEPQYNDAIEAIASLSPFTKEEYSFNFRS